MLYDAKGEVLSVGQTMSIGTNGFTKRSIVLDLADAKSKYPNKVQFVAVKDGCRLLDGIRVGQTVNIKFSVDGREWTGPKGLQYFTDLKIFRISACVDSEASISKPGNIKPAAAVAHNDACDVNPDDFPF